MERLLKWELSGHVLEAGVVTTPEERIACYKMRHDSYVSRGYIKPLPTGLDVDWADTVSTLFVSYIDGEIAGTFRVIHCEKGCLLTHGKQGAGVELISGTPFAWPETNPLTGEPILPEETLEGSREVAHVTELENGDRILQSNLLFDASWIWARANGRKQWVCSITDRHYQNAQRDGMGFIEIMKRPDGGPHSYGGDLCRVCILPIPPQSYQVRQILTLAEYEALHDAR